MVCRVVTIVNLSYTQGRRQPNRRAPWLFDSKLNKAVERDPAPSPIDSIRISVHPGTHLNATSCRLAAVDSGLWPREARTVWITSQPETRTGRDRQRPATLNVGSYHRRHGHSPSSTDRALFTPLIEYRRGRPPSSPTSWYQLLASTSLQQQPVLRTHK